MHTLNNRPGAAISFAAAVVIGVIVASALVVAMGTGGIGNFGYHMFWAQNMSADDTRGRLRTMFSGDATIVDSAEVSRAEVYPGRDSTRYFLLRLPASKIDQARSAAVRQLKQRSPGRFKERSDLDSFVGGAEPPYWWKAKDISDMDVVTDGARWFIFSRSAEIVYIADFEM